MVESVVCVERDATMVERDPCAEDMETTLDDTEAALKAAAVTADERLLIAICVFSTIAASCALMEVLS